MDKLIELVIGIIKYVTGNNMIIILVLFTFISGICGGLFIYNKLIDSIHASNVKTLEAIDSTTLKQLKRQLLVYEWERRSYPKDQVPERIYHEIDLWEQAIEELEIKMRIIQ